MLGVNDTVPVLYVIFCLDFCLRCAGILFAACKSFACSVYFNFFAVFFFFFFFFCSVQESIYSMFARNSFICSVFSLLKRCPLWATV